jgi:cytochrome c
MGHASSAFTEEPLFIQHLLGGIEWAAGAAEGDCTTKS